MNRYTRISGYGGEPEKFMSVIRARDRMISERSGHDPLFVDAMSDIESVISMRSDDGHVRLSAGEAAGSKLLKPRGSILTMTAHEALAADLSIATVSSLAELGESLGYPADQWHSGGRQGWAIMKTAAEESRSRAADRATQGAQPAAGQRLTADEIHKRLTTVRSALQAINTATQEARSQFEREQQAVQYTSAAYSRELYQQKQAEVQARYDQTAAELEKKRQLCEKEIAQLREMQKD